MRTKLLHHSAISSMPRDVMMFCCWSLPNSSLNSFCSTYGTCLGDAWYGLLSGFTCKENVTSKCPIPLNTYSNSFCSCFVILTLVFLSPCLPGHERKYLISLLIIISIKWHYTVYCLNLNCCLCLCLSLCLGLEENIQSH